jgi:hypothetical protein
MGESMWKLDNKQEMSEVVCDVCGEKGGVRVMVANEVIAEACDEHATEIRKKVRSMLVTRPGPPDRCIKTSENTKNKQVRCILAAGHDGEHQFMIA